MAEDTDKKPVRRIRKVETVREKTKAAEIEKRSVLGNFWYGFTMPVRLLGRGVKKVVLFFARFRAVRILGRIIFPRYIRNSWKELRMVIWPNAKQSRQLTLAVIMFAVVFGVLIALLDYGLDKVFKQVLLK